MTELHIANYQMPGAATPEDNPLPPLVGLQTASAVSRASDEASRLAQLEQRRQRLVLPYQIQDQYDRVRRPRQFKTAVLENEYLRATFLLELGGRMWSLVHKPTGRELLHVNPVFQPANLAIRNAWFSGGVEWNVSIIGHSPFTCAPLFAARVIDDDGVPLLRLYEWERLRCVPFQIDVMLPPGSPVLLVRGRISNPHRDPVAMYWWSNIAVNEAEDVRVLAPANHALRHAYDGRLVEHDVPIYDGVDVSYPTRRSHAADLYFQIPAGHRPWIAALDGQGRGLFQTSTRRLFGRKVFNWGTGPSGRHWQEFLSQPGEAYIEIQAGLAPTQGEYLTMPGGEQWTWLEAYGLMEADPAAVHSGDWAGACDAVEKRIERLLPDGQLDEALNRTAALADRAPVEMLHQGAGWGALEMRRRQLAGEKPFASAGLPFDEATLGEEQSAWLALLETGVFPASDPSQAPGPYMVQPQWRQLLEAAVAAGRCDHWRAWLHLGIMRHQHQECEGAAEAWERSLAATPSAWTLRNMAFLAWESGDFQLAADRWQAACGMLPTLLPLAVECIEALLQAGWADEALRLVARLDPAIRTHGRIRLLEAKAAVDCDKLDMVKTFFDEGVEVPNIREKETLLSDLWFQWHEKRLIANGAAAGEQLRLRVRKECPPPQRFDFRVSAAT